MERGIFNMIPFISGTVKNEGAFLTGLLKSFNQTVKTVNWQEVGPEYLRIKSDVVEKPTKEQIQLANIIRKYYSNEISTKEYPEQSVKNMFTDSGFFIPHQITVQEMSQWNPKIY